MVKQFLGLCAYYHKFIENFAQICAPLHTLTKGYKKGEYTSFTWSAECQKAFETLKMKLVNHPVLIWPDFTKQFTVVPDASGYAIGGGALPGSWQWATAHSVLFA